MPGRRGLTGAAALAAAVVAAAALAGCGLGGGDGGEVVAPTGAPYRYVVPDGMRRRDDVEVLSGAEDAIAVTAVALDRDDLIVVSAYELAEPASGLTREELVADLGRTVREAVGEDARISGPSALELRDATALAYDVTGARTPDGDPATLRIVNAFRGRTQVIVLCRATERSEDTLRRACDRLVGSLEIDA